MAANTNDYLHIIYQMDAEPGGAVQGDEDPYGDNFFPYIQVHKPEVIGIEDNDQFSDEYPDFVSQNYPNPVKTTSIVNVHLLNHANLSLEVYNMVGQKIIEINKGYTTAGIHQITIDATELPEGIYLYTVRVGDRCTTHKMIVE